MKVNVPECRKTVFSLVKEIVNLSNKLEMLIPRSFDDHVISLLKEFDIDYGSVTISYLDEGKGLLEIHTALFQGHGLKSDECEAIRVNCNTVWFSPYVEQVITFHVDGTTKFFTDGCGPHHLRDRDAELIEQVCQFYDVPVSKGDATNPQKLGSHQHGIMLIKKIVEKNRQLPELFTGIRY